MFHSIFPQNCKVKQQWTTTTTLLNGPNPTRATPNADKVVEQQEVSYIADGNIMQYSHFGT